LHITEVLVVHGEQIPHHDRRRGLCGQLRDPRGGRVDAHLQRHEVEAPLAGDDDLPVEHAALGQAGSQGIQELREVPLHGLLVPALEQEIVAVTKDQRAEPVPLRLVQPGAVLRQRGDPLRQHRFDGWFDGVAHAIIWPRAMPGG
jgi:hypothetical protein